MTSSIRWLAVGLTLCWFGCGGADRPVHHGGAVEETDEPDRSPPPIDVSAEIGAMDESAVTRVFQTGLRELQRCLDRGAKRVEFLGGSVAFFLKVDGSGRLAHVHLEQSSLGDHDTEHCMVEVLRAKTWPAPVGGKVGLVRKSFDFDPPNDVREPTTWEADRVSGVLDAKASEIRRCKGDASGAFSATLYVATSGSVLAVGVTPPDERGQDAVECLVKLLREQAFPKPGSWPAKVSFTL